MNWIYGPPWSTRLIAVLVLGLLGLAIWRWYREGRGGWALALRIAVTAALLFILLNPQTLLPRERTGKPKLVVLLDTSASMATADVGENSRLQAAVRGLSNPETWQMLNREFVLDVRRFDRDAGPLDLGVL